MVQKRGLSKEIIVNHARLILESRGLEKLTIRILAKELEVMPSALYNHFSSKQELIIALQAYYLHPDNQQHPIDYQAKTWQQFLISLATSSRLEFTERPYVLELFATHSSESEQSTIKFEKYLETMHNHGFSLLHAGQISHTIYTYIVGFCNFENNVRKNNKSNVEEFKPNPLIQKYPLTNEFMITNGWNFERDYQFGLEVLLEGFTKYCHANN